MASSYPAPLPGFRSPPPQLRALAPDGDAPAEPREDPPPARLPRVVAVTRKSAVLRPSRSAAAADVATLNLTLGCAHRCSYCFARAYANYPGDQVVYLYTNTADQLRDELKHTTWVPQTVLLSPSTDPFQPLAAVLDESYRTLEVLLDHRVGVVVWTKGQVRRRFLDLFAAHRDRVRVTVGISTLDSGLRRTIEPLAAPPRIRLRGIAALVRAGIRVDVRIDPLMPGLTDTRANLQPLFEELAGLGIRRVSASYLYLRRGIRDAIEQELGPLDWARRVLDPFDGGPVLELNGVAAAKYLPKDRRQKGYALLSAVAAEQGVLVGLASGPNPDFPQGVRPSAAAQGPHLPLFGNQPPPRLSSSEATRAGPGRR